MIRSNRTTNATVTLHLGSMTAALAAQRALAQAAIHSDIVKQDTDKRGCSYALTVARAQLDNARAVLSAAHINVRRYEDG